MGEQDRHALRPLLPSGSPRIGAGRRSENKGGGACPALPASSAPNRLFLDRHRVNMNYSDPCRWRPIESTFWRGLVILKVILNHRQKWLDTRRVFKNVRLDTDNAVCLWISPGGSMGHPVHWMPFTCRPYGLDISVETYLPLPVHNDISLMKLRCRRLGLAPRFGSRLGLGKLNQTTNLPFNPLLCGNLQHRHHIAFAFGHGEASSCIGQGFYQAEITRWCHTEVSNRNSRRVTSKPVGKCESRIS